MPPPLTPAALALDPNTALAAPLAAEAAPPPAAPAPAARFDNLSAAFAAANATDGLGLLLRAVQDGPAAGILANESLAWTILAPTEEAITARLSGDLSMTPEDLLANDTLLTQVQ